MITRRPHEARVIAEKTELDVRVFALEQFSYSDEFKILPEAEKIRIQHQHKAMQEYLKMLIERIAAFPPVEPSNVTELNSELAGTPLFKEEVPIGAKPIDDIDTFAMMIDHWHGKCMEHGNRLLEMPEGTQVEVEDEKTPGVVIIMDLNGAYLQTFRIGVEAALNLFKDLPFGASIEEAPESPVA
jgi:hypothetical protein